MNCLDFDRLLDQGEPSRLGPESLAHAEGCPRCARALASARGLERALDAHFAGADVLAPAGFADRVMARVAAASAVASRTPWCLAEDPLPWWTRLAAEPAVALAVALASLLLWRGDALLRAAAALPVGVRSVSNAALSHVTDAGLLASVTHAIVAPTVGSWAVTLAVSLALTPLLALAAWPLWRLGQRLTGQIAFPTR